MGSGPDLIVFSKYILLNLILQHGPFTLGKSKVQN